MNKESPQDQAENLAKQMYRVSRVGIVIDRSGSMRGRNAEVAEGFNEQLSAIVDIQDAAEAYLTVVHFDDYQQIIYRNVPAETVPRMKPTDFRPRGSTAMLDAMDATITMMKDDGNPQDAYLLVVITDGHENASHRVDRNELRRRVDRLQQKGGWTFACMVRKNDVSALLNAVPIPPGNVATWDPQIVGGTREAYTGMAVSTCDYYAKMATHDDSAGAFSMTNFFEEKEEDDEDD
jgi:uncharacterized protein YegL